MKTRSLQKKTNKHKIFYEIAQWSLVVFLISYNVIVVAYENRYRDTVKEEVETSLLVEQKNTVSLATEQISEYLHALQMEGLLIAKIVSLAGFDFVSQETLETIAYHDVMRNWVTEIYIVEKGFTGEAPPRFTYEIDPDTFEEANPTEHSLEAEAEEYSEIIDHLKIYNNDLKAEILISKTISLCVDNKGQVLTLPIRKKDELIGLVALMLPIEQENKLLLKGISSSNQKIWIATSEGLTLSQSIPQISGIESQIVSLLQEGQQSSTVGEWYLSIGSPIKIGNDRWNVIAALPKSYFQEQFVTRLGGPWSMRLIIILLLGNLLMLLIWIALRHWSKEVEILQFHAERDPLTGLFTRRFLDKYGDHLDQHYQSIIIFVIDMDGLKLINDTLGHEAGDSAINAVAEILRQSIRSDDFALRTGGDEFMLLLLDSDVQVATKVQKRILNESTIWNKLEPDRAFHIYLSIGMASGPVSELYSLIKKADKKMYENKVNNKKKGQKIIQSAML